MTTVRTMARPSSCSLRSDATLVPDDELVARMKNGDCVAFETIMRRHNGRLYRISRSVLRNDAEAEDVVQETYVRAYAKLDDFVGPGGFSAWLSKIAFNEALQRLHRRNRFVSLDEFMGAPARSTTIRRSDTLKSEAPDPERETSNGELRHLIEGAVDSLPASFRAVFVLRAIEGFSVAETAETLGIRSVTVKTRFFRARRRLQKILSASNAYPTDGTVVYPFGGMRCDGIVSRVQKILFSP